MIMHRKNCFHEECYFQKIASPKISIIVPVYNPGNGFARCLKSLQEQKVTDIEIILIDDCSTDGSMELGRNAALKDKRIRILVNEENRGAGFSRNRGIEEASGEYLAFVDPDDYIAADFLELLYNKATESHPDILKGEVNQVSISGKVNDGSNEKSLNQIIREGLQKGIPLYRLFSYNHWTAIYNRLFLLRTGARYGLTRNSQDTAFLLRTCYFTNFIDFADCFHVLLIMLVLVYYSLGIIQKRISNHIKGIAILLCRLYKVRCVKVVNALSQLFFIAFGIDILVADFRKCNSVSISAL